MINFLIDAIYEKQEMLTVSRESGGLKYVFETGNKVAPQDPEAGIMKEVDVFRH